MNKLHLTLAIVAWLVFPPTAGAAPPDDPPGLEVIFDEFGTGSASSGIIPIEQGGTVIIRINGRQGDIVFLLGSVTPPPIPAPIIGGEAVGIDPTRYFPLGAPGLLGPEGTRDFVLKVPHALPPGTMIYVQGFSITPGSAGLQASAGIVLVVDESGPDEVPPTQHPED